MDCKTCDHVLAAFRHSVSLYKQAMQEVAGLGREDFQLALRELERLRANCQDANEAVMAHWWQEHGDLSHKAASA